MEVSIRIIDFYSYSEKKWDIISLKGMPVILPLNSKNRLQIIRIVKHSIYSDNQFLRQLAYLKILILRKEKKV